MLPPPAAKIIANVATPRIRVAGRSRLTAPRPHPASGQSPPAGSPHEVPVVGSSCPRAVNEAKPASVRAANSLKFEANFSGNVKASLRHVAGRALAPSLDLRFGQRLFGLAIGLIENTGHAIAIKREALRAAQMTEDVSQLLDNLRAVQAIIPNRPVLNPPADYAVPAHALAVVLGGEARP